MKLTKFIKLFGKIIKAVMTVWENGLSSMQSFRDTALKNDHPFSTEL